MKTLSDEEKAALQKQIDRGRADRKERSERLTSGSEVAQRYYESVQRAEQQIDRPDQATVQGAESLVEINGQQYELALPPQRVVAQSRDKTIGYAMFGVGVVSASVTGRPALFVLSLALAVLYAVFRDGLWNGQSLGNRWTGLKVIDEQTGEPCSFRQSLSRWGWASNDTSNTVTVVVRVPVTSRP